jgi:N-acetylglucosamine-6-phosphate deacetylase
MVEAVARAADAVDAGDLLGVHVEGPFLSAGRCGAQDPRWLRRPDPAVARDLIAAGRGHVRVMTIAPELDGAGRVTDALLEHGVVPAVGHTEADVALVRRTLRHVRESLGRPALVTHLFNAMPPLHHRAPGPVAGALGAAARGDALVELIADGVHLADETARTVFDLLGPERVVLVTDAMAAAGVPDGSYDLGPQRVRVRGGVARLEAPDETAAPIAGGTAHLLDVVRRCWHAGVALEHAVQAATSTPAAALGLSPRGLNRDGTADLVVTDSDLRPLRVMRAGAWLS